MASFAYPTLAVVLLFLSLAVFANENSTASPGGKNVTLDQPMKNLNLTNTTNRCESHKPKLRISESDVKNIINAMHKYTTNGVEIEVTIDSKNETRSFPKYKWSWAGEIGRTIISLITYVAGNKFYSITLTPGIAKVNVVVSELTRGCLPTGNNGTELVFNFLLHQLSHSDDTHDYKLCRTHADEDGLKRYNCCRITTGNLIICADHAATNLIANASAYVFQGALLFSGILFPLIIQYLRSSSNKKEDYEISDSPLAISTIFYTLFIAEYGFPKSTVRRLFVWLFPGILSFIILPLVPAILVSVAIFNFMPLDIFYLHDPGHDFDDQSFNDYIFTITSLFNIKLWGKLYSSLGYSRPTTIREKFLWAVLSVILFPIVYIIVFHSVMLTVGYVFVMTLHPSTHVQHHFLLWRYGKFVLSLSAAFLFIFTISVFLHLIFLMIAGIYLNAQLYIPYLIPIIAIIIYSLKQWRLSVETKYLVLKINIYKVCKELWEENKPEGITESPMFLVDITNGKVPKPLYNMAREEILPFDRVFFYFFVKIFLVANFFLLLIFMISSGQESNISVTVHIISTITLSTLPFIFDTLWRKDTSEQNQLDKMKQKIQIRSMMTLVERRKTVATVSLNVVKKDTSIINFGTFLRAFNPILSKHFSRNVARRGDSVETQSSQSGNSRSGSLRSGSLRSGSSQSGNSQSGISQSGISQSGNSQSGNSPRFNISLTAAPARSDLSSTEIRPRFDL